MPSAAQFLEAIANDPVNDQPRLAYADWLTENKKPFGEFIRIQLELARTNDIPYLEEEATAGLRKREGALLKKHGETWRKELLPAWARHVNAGFYRGFPGVWCNSSDWIQHGDSLVARMPVHRLNVRATQKTVVELSQSQALLKVRILDLSNSPLDDASFAAFVAAPAVGKLTGLYAWQCGLGCGAAQAVATASHLTCLRRLNLEENRITADGIAALVSAPAVHALTYFNVRSNHVGPEATVHLRRAAWFANLVELNLGNNDLGPECVAAISEVISSPLRVLSLDGNAMQDTGAEALAAATQVRQLTSLNIAYNQLSARGAQAIAAARQFATLTELDLSANALGQVGIQALATSRHLSNLVQLTLASVVIGNFGAQAIAQSSTLVNLRKLNLWDCEIDSEGAQAMAASPTLETLESLCLLSNPFDRNARQALRARFAKRVQM